MKSMDGSRGKPVECCQGGRIMDQEGTAYRRGQTERGPAVKGGCCRYQRKEPLPGSCHPLNWWMDQEGSRSNTTERENHGPKGDRLPKGVDREGTDCRRGRLPLSEKGATAGELPSTKIVDGSRGNPIERCWGGRLTEEGVAVRAPGAATGDGLRGATAGDEPRGATIEELSSTKLVDESRGEPVEHYRGGRITDREGTDCWRGRLLLLEKEAATGELSSTKIVDGSRGEPIECCRGGRLTKEGATVRGPGAGAGEGPRGELPGSFGGGGGGSSEGGGGSLVSPVGFASI